MCDASIRCDQIACHSAHLLKCLFALRTDHTRHHILKRFLKLLVTWALALATSKIAILLISEPLYLLSTQGSWSLRCGAYNLSL